MASIYQQLIARVEELATYIGNELQLRGFKRGGTVGQVPVKSGAGDFAWAWGDMTGGGEPYQSATAPDPTEHPLWLNTINGALYQWYGTPPDGVWVNVSHEQAAQTGFTEIAFLGDSITQTASEWATQAIVGTGVNSVYHTARFETANISAINVSHVNSGASQSLLVSVVGTSVTVRLATDGAGVITSTVTEVRNACNASSAYLALGLLASCLGTTQLAQASAAKYLIPTTANTADGYAAWMHLLSKGRFEPIRFNPTTYAGLLAGSWTFGKSGLTTGSIITYLLPDVLILAAGKMVVEMSGANDVLNGVAEATTVTNRTAMWDAMEAVGITVVACEVTPMIESAPLVDAGDNAKIVSLNAALKAEAESRGILWIEWPATLFNGSDAEATLWEVDGIHPNPAGCRIMGAHVLAEIDTILSADEFVFPFDGSSKWVTANPYMTGGTTVATGWSAPTAFPNATVTPSLETIDGRQWQRLTVAQSGTEFKMTQFNLENQAVTAGQRVRIAAFIKVSEGFKNVRVKLVFNGPGGDMTAFKAIDDGVNMTSADYAITLPAHEGYWISHPEIVPTGATSATLAIRTFGEGTVDIGICGVINEDASDEIEWPTSPADKDTFTQNGIQWIYDASIPAWARYATTSGGFVVSDTPPTNTDLQWFNSNNGVTYTYYDGAWIAESPTLAPAWSEVTGKPTFTSLATANAVAQRDAAGSIKFYDVEAYSLIINSGGEFSATTLADNLLASRTYQEPDASGVRALTADSQGRPDALYNGTISGTVAFGTGAAAAFWAALGGDGTQTIGGAKSYSGQVELLNQSATNATSAMTRSLTQTEIAKTKAFEIASGNSYTFKITGQSSGVTFAASGTGIDVNARSFSGGVSTISDLQSITATTYSATTVASLGTATAYKERWVSDALAPTIGATATGGGSVKAKVAGNGANWIVIAII